MYKENFHSHTTYCDGKNTAKEMIESAIAHDFNAIGFSGHSYLDFGAVWSMSPENEIKYREEINNLKIKYADKIKIYCGLECDILSKNINLFLYDYAIGSVHYVQCNGNYLAVDESEEVFRNDVNKYFNGDFYAYAESYFDDVSNVLEVTNADIIGHFDLVTKFNKDNKIFDTNNPKYKTAWKKAVDKLIPYGKPFEINTGNMARGNTDIPYPSKEICDYIDSKGGYFIVTSDCHKAEMIDFGFEETYKNFAKYKIVSFAEMLENK